MKKIFYLLLLICSVSFGQNATPFTKVKITGNITSSTATKVNVQEANGEVNTISKNDLIDNIFVATIGDLPTVGVDGKIYAVKNVNKLYRWNGTFYSEFAGSGGGGDVSGLVPYTGATIDVNLGVHGITTDFEQFNTTNTQTNAIGKLKWNDTDGTLDLGLKGGNVTLQIGQETVARVVNKTSTNITLSEGNYQAIRVTGAIGKRPKIDLALANNDLNSATTLGLVTETILNNAEGFITTSGQVREINTTGSLQGETWLDGDILYLSGTIAGQITNIKPIAPIHTVIIGFVEYAHAIHGKIFVKVNNGYELEELHNVSAIVPNDNEVLTYENASSLWKPKTIVSALGYTPYNATNPNGYTSNSGTVTSVSNLTLGTTGIDVSSTVANGTTTPVITLNIPTASAANRGALNSTDWSVFNSKQNALTNPVTGTGTTNIIPKITGASTIGDSQIIDNGTNVSIGAISTTSKLSITDTALAGSGSLAGNALNIVQTWNTTGIPTAIKLNVTNTASTGATKLIDLQTGAVTKFSVTPTGTTSTTKLLLNGAADVGATINITGASLQNGNIFFSQPTPTALTATGTLTIAQILTGLETVTSATAVSLTLPTGTLTDAGILGGLLPVQNAFEWTIINLGSATGIVTLVAGVGHTIVGLATIPILSQATFRTTKTATNTFVTYRVY